MQFYLGLLTSTILVAVFPVLGADFVWHAGAGCTGAVIARSPNVKAGDYNWADCCLNWLKLYLIPPAFLLEYSGGTIPFDPIDQIPVAFTTGDCVFLKNGGSAKSISFSGVPHHVNFFVESGGKHDKCTNGPAVVKESGSGCATGPAG
ncbi:hypothetical protein FB45DRAFT_873333 [Roridomyces roridus]|uniref:Uncharacterized protein n=1 Tax=Roridomyces roridus TaxID=1738132 RepID=A0AAD7BBQ2_9AGAR|nr:hypothetical protein FB45DRAFT_873333 [Roridomyces roridus]